MELGKVLHKTTQLLQTPARQVKIFRSSRGLGPSPRRRYQLWSQLSGSATRGGFHGSTAMDTWNMEFCSSYSILQMLLIGRELKLVYTVYTMKAIWDFCWFQKSWGVYLTLVYFVLVQWKRRYWKGADNTSSICRERSLFSTAVSFLVEKNMKWYNSVAVGVTGL